MHLLDAFTEMMYFTFVNKEYDFAQFGHGEMQTRFKDMITRAQARAKQSGFTDTQWLDSLFAVTTWADEIILLSQWQDKHLWQKETLQRTYFHTAHGGVEFYNRLQAIDRNDTAVREVYTLCMSLGFKGMYYQDAHEKIRSDITTQNLRLILQDKNTAMPQVFFPCGYFGMEETNRDRHKRVWQIRDVMIFSIGPLIVTAGYLFFHTRLANLAKIWFTGN